MLQLYDFTESFEDEFKAISHIIAGTADGGLPIDTGHLATANKGLTASKHESHQPKSSSDSNFKVGD